MVNKFLRFAQKSFKKWPMSACSFSKGFCANPENGLTNGKSGIALLVISKAFGVKRLRTYKFNKISKGLLNKVWMAGRPCPNPGLSNQTTFSPFYMMSCRCPFKFRRVVGFWGNRIFSGVLLTGLCSTACGAAQPIKSCTLSQEICQTSTFCKAFNDAES